MYLRFTALGSVFVSVCAAGILPIETLDNATAAAFDRFAAAYENGPDARFREDRTLMLDSKFDLRRKVESGELVVQVVRAENVARGHIQQTYGAIHLKGITAAQVRQTMQQYSKYSIYFKPDITASRGDLLPGGTTSEQFFNIDMKMVQSTLWFEVAFDAAYKTHYLRLDDHSFETVTKSSSIREYKDAHNPSLGAYAAGEDHGFLWRMETWWHARDSGDGVDMEMTNMTLSRPVPFAFNWWASRKARSSVERLLLRTRDTVLAAQPAQGSATLMKPGSAAGAPRPTPDQ